MRHNVHTLALEQAARILGGSVALHDYLRVPSQNLSRWMSGQEQVPVVIFLRVVDLLEAHAVDAKPRGARPGVQAHH